MEPYKFAIGSKVKSTDIYGNTVYGTVTLCTFSELWSSGIAKRSVCIPGGGYGEYFP